MSDSIAVNAGSGRGLRLWRMFVCIATLVCNVAPAYPEGMIPQAVDKVVQVRGHDSIVEELNMGPISTEYWRKLQALIAHPEWLEDFPKIVDLFGLTITDPVDAVDVKSQEIRSRFDIKDERYGNMTSITYGVTKDHYDENSRVIRFTFVLDANNICITNSEVRAIYGRGSVGVMAHWDIPPEVKADPIGFRFSEAYGKPIEKIRRSPVAFAYSPSGCLWQVSLQRPVETSK